MMHAELRYIGSSEISDLESYRPDDPDVFSLIIELRVGPSGMDGEELFYVEVCTPGWLLKKYQSTDTLFPLGMMIVFRYEWDSIKARISHYINNCCHGETWDVVVRKICRVASWEFDDYVDSN